MHGSGARNIGVLAGSDMPLEQLGEWLKTASYVIAADGGSDRCRATGIIPNVTLGDLDSIADTSGLPRIIRDSDAETSDCDKLLAFADDVGLDRLTLVGIEGDRPDHVLGTLASVARSRLPVRLALRRGIGWVLRSGARIACLPNETLSVMPLVETSGFTLRGVRWPLERVLLSPFGQVSLSNVTTGHQVELEFETGAVAVFLISEARERPDWGDA